MLLCADGSLQHKVLVLLDHLSHSENQAVVQLLAQRAQSQTHTHQESTAAPPERLGRSSHDSWVGQPAAQSDNAGLGTCTLRLLKLLSRGMLNSTQLQLGAMIQKGAFSEIFAGTVSMLLGYTPSIACHYVCAGCLMVLCVCDHMTRSICKACRLCM